MRSPLPLAGEAPPEVPLYEGDQAQLERDVAFVSRKRMAEKIVGGFSYPSKMPCPAWGIPARRCRVGSVLARQEGTVCSECYAEKNLFRMRTVQDKYEARYRGLFNTLWTPAMVAMVRWYCDDYMRLFDSGDLQGVSHLLNIFRIAESVRDVTFWMPTREIETVREAQKAAQAPPNLVIRVSAHLIDGKPPRGFQNTSTVVSDHEDATCPAPGQGNNCRGCRACWDKDVANVSYLLH